MALWLYKHVVTPVVKRKSNCHTGTLTCGMLCSNCERGFYDPTGITPFFRNKVVTVYDDSVPPWCEHSVLMGGQNTYIVASQDTSQ